MKILFASFVAVFLISPSVFAQDTLILISGDTIACKVQKIEKRNVFFTLNNDLSDKIYEVKRKHLNNFQIPASQETAFKSPYVKSKIDYYNDGNIGASIGYFAGINAEYYFNDGKSGIQFSVGRFLHDDYIFHNNYGTNMATTFHIPLEFQTSSENFTESDIRYRPYDRYPNWEETVYAHGIYNYDQYLDIPRAILVGYNRYLREPYRKLRPYFYVRAGLNIQTTFSVHATSKYSHTRTELLETYYKGAYAVDYYDVDVRSQKKYDANWTSNFGGGISWQFCKFLNFRTGVDFFIFDQIKRHSTLQVTNRDQSISNYGGGETKEIVSYLLPFAGLVFTF